MDSHSTLKQLTLIGAGPSKLAAQARLVIQWLQDEEKPFTLKIRYRTSANTWRTKVWLCTPTTPCSSTSLLEEPE